MRRSLNNTPRPRVSSITFDRLKSPRSHSVRNPSFLPRFFIAVIHESLVLVLVLVVAFRARGSLPVSVTVSISASSRSPPAIIPSALSLCVCVRLSLERNSQVSVFLFRSLWTVNNRQATTPVIESFVVHAIPSAVVISRAVVSSFDRHWLRSELSSYRESVW